MMPRNAPTIKILPDVVFFIAAACVQLTLLAFADPLQAQDWATTNIRDRHRVDLRDLGYPEVNEIPVNSSAITSLLTASGGKIYGGTSGEAAYLFVFDPAVNKVRHLGKIGHEEGVHHSLVEGRKGMIFIGTGKSILNDVPLSKGGIGPELIDVTLWRDIKKTFADYPGGHLYRYRPQVGDEKVKLADMQCEVEDLGIPVANNSIYALTVDPERDVIYGLTYPDGHFFVYEIAKKQFRDLGLIDKKRVFHGPERHWRSLPRALVCDEAGRVFTSSTNGELKYYCPHSGKIESTGLEIPGDYYHVQFHEDYAVAECFAKDAGGLIYGGTSDGYLFSFDTKKMKLVNHGKPRAERRLRCLAIGRDGKVYMAAGERVTSRPCQLYSYDPRCGGFEDLGLVIVDRSPYYYWRGYQFDSMTTGRDGTIYLGESERRSHLFLFIP